MVYKRRRKVEIASTTLIYTIYNTTYSTISIYISFVFINSKFQIQININSPRNQRTSEPRNKNDTLCIIFGYFSFLFVFFLYFSNWNWVNETYINVDTPNYTYYIHSKANNNHYGLESPFMSHPVHYQIICAYKMLWHGGKNWNWNKKKWIEQNSCIELN